MRWVRGVSLLVGFSTLLSCGDHWTPGDPPHTREFRLECAHAEATCESCHPADRPITKLDTACIACHLDARPLTHDPATTNACDDCHQGSCSWHSADNPHPDGFADPAQHGLEAVLQGPEEGDCRSCHGADLRGGTTIDGGQALGCDDCHAENGHPDWRTDCVYCHGGANDATGAPPRDIDGATTPGRLSFQGHPAHVEADPRFRTLTCTECHTDRVDAMSDNHWWDATPGEAELDFSRGIGDATTWDGASCANNYCHGGGWTDDGVVVDGTGPLDCESCHPTSGGWDGMSGLHQAHLANDPSIVCNDCHGAVIDRDGNISTPTRHVDGARDIAFPEPTLTSTNGGGTCAGVCHGYEHDTLGWGHVPDYELPELHGVDSNTRALDCGPCHGEDWTGTDIAQGCDDCHTTEGHDDWRTDCTFCHGGTTGDTTGAPPQDIDDTVAPNSISFQAHRDHVGTSPIGHPAYDCTQCHAEPVDALTPGHAIDGTAGIAEVSLLGGTSPEGGWDPTAQACSNLYCHGNGQAPSGAIADGTTALDCDSCHAYQRDLDSMSGTHAEHLAVAGVTCADCHVGVVNPQGDIVDPDRHVDRVVDWDADATGFSAVEGACTITCHGVEHDQLGWGGNHPDGFEDPLQHGQEALLRLQACTGSACHGVNLQGPQDGAAGSSCDECHDAGWRANCVWCHGGENGDVSGVPPQDIDNQANENLISFEAHPEHAAGRISPSYDCATCHDAGSYEDAVTDPGHWLTGDATETVAEVDFSGLATGVTWAVGTCSNDYCHGNGQTNGASLDGSAALTCNSCHKYDQSLTQLSGTHSLHLAVSGVSCADCHGDVVDATGAVVTPNRHVDGAIDVDAAAGFDPVAETCATSCHGHDHQGTSWLGHHPPGYDNPLQHGQEAIFRQQDCATSGCHGVALDGGASGQACDTCHTPNWRRDCVFCHGGALGDVDGLPPEDLDNVGDQDQITFQSHPEHHDGDDHRTLDCDQCHGAAAADYVDAFTDAGHWWKSDATIGRAEVDFSDGLAADGAYHLTTKSCSGVYCHGDGVTDGTVTDGNLALGCDDCHATSDPAALSGSHAAHLAASGVTCADCHAPVVGPTNVVTAPSRHVDGLVDLDPTTTGWDAATETCANACHGVDHSDLGWTGHHPAGYDDPLEHGQDALFRIETCTDCHGADLRGGTGDSCDSCHAIGWRADCTYCHGGENGDLKGVPPQDLDNVTNEAQISFKAHPEHVDADIHPSFACDTCHNGAAAYADAVTDAGHWLVTDATVGASEVKFGGIALGGAYTAGSCTNDYCHGDGQVNGTVSDGTTALTCDGCHAFDTATDRLSGTHDLHLAESGVTCADCHSDVDATGAITTPAKHVNKLVDLDQVKTGWSSTSSSCTITCHTHTHTGSSWLGQHPVGYDDPAQHGQEALFKAQDCATSGCHGTDLGGGSSGVGCDDCHVAGWREDCTYCHGGQLGDGDGLPPEDLDNVTNEDLITFMAHPEHHDADDHASMDCAQCHGTASSGYSDAFTDPGHWWTAELSPGVAEIDFTDGLSPLATYNAVTGTCSGLYCHGDGQTSAGLVTDSKNGLGCEDCHSTTAGWAAMSGTHEAHMLVSGVTCADCHGPVVNATNVVTTPSLHVDGAVNINATTSGWSAGSQSCTITCHGTNHSGMSWSGYHPPGYEDATVHGQDALFRLDTCTDCHGPDLRGGTGDSCDSCHTAGWRGDCTYCHGGVGADTRGAPPEDIDNNASEATISFEAHPEHADSDIHPLYACDTCHTGAAAYTDAVLDAGHWLASDATSGKAEVKFNGIALGGTYSNGTCSNDYCHGNGQVNGTVSDGGTALTCDGCHAYATGTDDLSGTHSLHLAESGVTCADCHSDVSSTGTITTPTKHVNKVVDIDQVKSGWVSAAETCTITCHTHTHTGTPWVGGHPAGYDAPEVHGQEALLKTQDCATSGCHGTDLGGGSSGVGCDDCHQAGWRSDCTYCHGGQLGDVDGLPPEDLDNVTNEDLISFMAHPEHHDADDHKLYDCDQCHGSASLTYSDAFLDPGHWWTSELTPGVADIDMTDGLSPLATYSATTSTCSTMYCHGDGNKTTKSQADSANALTCHTCHPDKTSSSWSTMSGDHSKHKGELCSDCHATVVDSTGLAIIAPSLHVDGAKQAVAASATGLTFTKSGTTITCSGGKCHGQDHSHTSDKW